MSNPGKICAEPLDCEIYTNVTTCTKVRGCNWRNEKCISNKTCSSGLSSGCSHNECVASDCIQCHQLPGCDWSYSERKCVVGK